MHSSRSWIASLLLCAFASVTALTSSAPEQVRGRFASGAQSGSSGTGTCDATNVAAGASNCAILDPATDFTYLGSFRVNNSVWDLTYSGFGGIDYDPTTGDILWTNGSGAICEMSIPTLRTDADPVNLNLAPFVQDCQDGTEGNLNADFSTYVAKTGGLFTTPTYVYGNAYAYFGDGSEVGSHFRHNRTLSSTGGYAGSWAVWSTTPSDHAQGWTGMGMGRVPSEWQTALGGPAYTFGGGMPIVTRTCFGHCVFTFDPTQINVGSEPLAATKILGHPDAHPLNNGCYACGEVNEIWNGNAQYRGIVHVNGTRTVMIFGGHGPVSCYGIGGAGPPTTDCEDPFDASHGLHAYPMRDQVWVYDANALKRVKDGLDSSWTPTPTLWLPTSPYSSNGIFGMGGATYDAIGKRLFIMQVRVYGCVDQCLPIIRVYSVNNHQS